MAPGPVTSIDAGWKIPPYVNDALSVLVAGVVQNVWHIWNEYVTPSKTSAFEKTSPQELHPSVMLIVGEGALVRSGRARLEIVSMTYFEQHIAVVVVLKKYV